ncbi:MAG: UDP-N-acetylglucosamine--N-acetylmuramyl-(pentapeptide) pyrophosphoryl-undecaprenol N-acetylglucosamine transferase [Phycisphaerae bacterium]|jgi:UDP-N-acetylglucosamine--N-acetylmuramyl-(pentapeptide) pyrophosphoryl-undecaprenol N-acetylglucosamine transferase|nr:MAG: UDP-N-acetylglucosamine--N-acetylmuramyl-(pentapeptide) pyrophosphoryl-undecaprenol N-acetylglucosamine transferase [Phycisphaerae bacterium]
MNGPVTIFFAGGGTGGHLYPGISVAQALARECPEIKPVFLCTNRPIDRTILEPTGFEFITQPIQPPVRSIGGLLNFWKSWRDTRDQLRVLIRERKPLAVLGLGGYAAGPAVKWCSEKKIPAAILNPDVIPGKANHYLLKYVQHICCQFEATRACLPPAHQHKMVVTGCPIRQEICPLPPREQAARRLGLDPNLNTLTITGASQGAQTVNQAVLECFKSIKLQGWNILHLAGKDHAQSVRAEYRQLNIPAIVIDFTPSMNDVWSVTDLVVARSGASTCAEITACGIPGILMPYPFHKDMHQRANAKVLADAGCAILLEDQKDRRRNAAQLQSHLTVLLSDATRRRCMSENANKIAHPDAAVRVARLLISMVNPS